MVKFSPQNIHKHRNNKENSDLNVQCQPLFCRALRLAFFSLPNLAWSLKVRSQLKKGNWSPIPALNPRSLAREPSALRSLSSISQQNCTIKPFSHDRHFFAVADARRLFLNTGCQSAYTFLRTFDFVKSQREVIVFSEEDKAIVKARVKKKRWGFPRKQWSVYTL